jgi:hypothetical protein
MKFHPRMKFVIFMVAINVTSKVMFVTQENTYGLITWQQYFALDWLYLLTTFSKARGTDAKHASRTPRFRLRQQYLIKDSVNPYMHSMWNKAFVLNKHTPTSNKFTLCVCVRACVRLYTQRH